MTSEKEKEKINIINVMRSLITSLKPPVALQRILRDFAAMEGYPLPFRKFGFSSAMEMLQSTGAFSFRSVNNEVCITAQINPRSQHIVAAVRLQKKGKNNGALTRPPVPRSRHKPGGYLGNAVRERGGYGGNAGYSNPSNPRILNQSRNDIIQHQHQIEVSQSERKVQAERIRVAEERKALEEEKKKLHEARKALEQDKAKFAFEKALEINTNKENSQVSGTAMNGKHLSHGQGGSLVTKPPLRPILGHSAQQRTHHASEEHNKQPVSYEHKRISHQTAQPLQQNVGAKKSVNERLKLKPTVELLSPPMTPKNTSTKSSGAVSFTEKPYVQSANNTQSGRFISGKEFDAVYDGEHSLKQYCFEKSYGQPKYKYSTKNGNVICAVRIDHRIITTFPEEYSDPKVAMNKVSQLALQKLYAESHNSVPECPLSDDEFVDGLFHELLRCPNGIVFNKLPEWYEQIFNHQVPKNWKVLVTGSHKFRKENFDKHIIYANNADLAGSAVALYHKSSNPMAELLLPWPETVNGWPFYITHCSSTSQVWGRLIYSEQYQLFEELSSQLNKFMSNSRNRRPAEDIAKLQTYIVESNDGWCRVRVMALDEAQRNCSCFFVDYGDTANFSYEELFVCESQILGLPPQAVCMSMYALENYDGHPHALDVLCKEISYHSVIAKIMTTESQFIKSGGRTDGVIVGDSLKACIVALLYDTSTAEDINLNELIFEKIKLATPAPKLQLEKKSNPVLVSHINDNGDLFVCLVNEDLKFVQNSIAKIMAGSTDQHRVVFADLLHDGLFFVCDESTDGLKQWYRGKLMSKPNSKDEETFDVHYVDDGRTRKTHISNLYRLEALNMALAQYPAQAIRVRLHDVPPIDNNMVGRLRALMSPQSEVLLKVMVNSVESQPPLVTIHARGSDGLYVCFNSAIRIEYEVQSSSKMDSVDDNSHHSSLMRRSSLSSTISSNSSNSSELFVSTKLKPFEAIPAVGAYFEVRVALSVNPGNFAIQPYKFYNQLQKLMKDMQTHCKSADAETLQPSQLLVGQAYAAPADDGVYHRVIIFKIYDEMIHVRFVDLGDDAVVRCSQLRQLPLKMLELPKMGLPAQLYGIKLQGVTWTKENSLRFRELTLGKKCIAIVRKVEKVKNEIVTITTELIDTSTLEDIKIHEVLIAENQAQPC